MQEGQSSIIQIIIVGTILLVLIGGFVVSFMFFYKNKQRVFQLEKKSMTAEFQQTLLQTQLEIQEQTLKNISQEIHDNVGQVLSLAKLNLNTMDITKTEQLKGKIDNTLVQVSKAINDLRDLSKSFNTDNIAAIGLVRAIEYEMEMIRKTGSHKTNFEIAGKTRKIAPQQELILFRIVQEVLHNIIKHAEAGTINVLVNYEDNNLELEINDDGKGFDIASLNMNSETGSGLGIRNMNNRCKLIGADLTMNSRTGKGTIVKIILPYENKGLIQSKTEIK